jgi:hypothetical protein
MLKTGILACTNYGKHKDSIMQAAMLDIKPTRDTFILSFNVYNLVNKKAKELYEKHSNDAMGVCL